MNKTIPLPSQLPVDISRLVQAPSYRQGLGLPPDLCESYQFLAQGEYNINLSFSHPQTQKPLVLRINTASQMGLTAQITYESRALDLLYPSGRTPKVYYVDDTKVLLPYGVLVMDYLEGRPLSYETDLEEAAQILADIHSLPLAGNPQGDFLLDTQGIPSMVAECQAMLSRYTKSPLQKEEVASLLGQLLRKGEELARGNLPSSPGTCCINTELNSSNFLIQPGGRSHLIDWEKPLRGDPAQDLGHFLAPTTTLWKTQSRLRPQEMESFVRTYAAKVQGFFPTQGLWERTQNYLAITCLRGLTWSAMAWVDYQNPAHLVKNPDTWEKLCLYLSPAFLEEILDLYA